MSESMFDEDVSVSEELEPDEQVVPDGVAVAGRGLSEALSLSKVAKMVDEDDMGKFDVHCRIGDLKFTAVPFSGNDPGTKNLCYLSLKDGIFDTGVEHLEFDTENKSLRQLLRFINIADHRFILRYAPPGLAQKNVEVMSQAREVAERPIMLRCRRPGTGPGKKKDSKVPYCRGVLNSSYGVFDNHRMLDMVKPYLEKGGYLVQGLSLNDHGFHMRMVHPDVKKKDKNDPITHGMCFSNSETGHGSVSADFMIYRVVCSNGLVHNIEGKRLFEIRHSSIDETLLRETVRRGFERIIDEHAGPVAAFRSLRNIELKNPEIQLQNTMRLAGVGSKYGALILDIFNGEVSKEPWAGTAYGVVNTFTLASQKIADPSDRLALDKAAGRAMSMFLAQK